MKAALLSACLLAASAVAQQPDRTDAPRPCTPTPSSGNCGFTGLLGVEDLHTRIQGIYDEVYRLTGNAGPQPPIAWVQTDYPYPAMSRHAGGRRDNPNYDMAVTQHLCELAHSEDEVAAIFAHELGHYAHGDNAHLDAILATARAACPRNDSDCVNARAAPQRWQLEDQAEAYSAAVMSRTGSRFDPQAGVQALEHYCDLRNALGEDLEPDQIHLPISQRIERYRDKLRAADGSSAP